MVSSEIEKLYKEYTGKAAESITMLSAAGSHRKYFRISGNPTLIGVLGTSIDENEAFFSISSQLAQSGVNVPKVIAISTDRICYLQNDLGDLSLFDAIKGGRESGNFSVEEISLLTDTIRKLPSIQFAGNGSFDFSKCYPVAQFDRRSILWDLNYFKYCFLKATSPDFSESALEDDFDTLADILLSARCDTFMYRDFQSRNVMIKDGQPWYIDFQGGRRGPIYYDVASFLWQAKANLPQTLRDKLICEYLDALRPYRSITPTEFAASMRHFVLFRTIQVLGAYGFRGYFERKEHFLESVPYAMDNLRTLLESPFSEYPYLDSLLRKLTDTYSKTIDKPALTIKVYSFSYKKGIPDDTTDNGGGFVFDCRWLHNPGKYDEYKPYTGLDANVKKFLEDDGEVYTFLSHCYALVDSAVERYISRGFTSLMVCFGCTGGRHRSVYCAQHMAEHLAAKYPTVNVRLEHRERNIINLLSH